MMGKKIDEHKATLDSNNPRDLLDAFLVEMETSKDPEFTEEQLEAICFDLFVAGSETTSTTMNWILMYLTKYQATPFYDLAFEINKFRPA